MTCKTNKKNRCVKTTKIVFTQRFDYQLNKNRKSVYLWHSATTLDGLISFYHHLASVNEVTLEYVRTMK
jgi:hypothetical protein